MLTKDNVKELLDRMPETFSLDFFIEQLLLLENEGIPPIDSENREGID